MRRRKRRSQIKPRLRLTLITLSLKNRRNLIINRSIPTSTTSSNKKLKKWLKESHLQKPSPLQAIKKRP